MNLLESPAPTTASRPSRVSLVSTDYTDHISLIFIHSQ